MLLLVAEINVKLAKQVDSLIDVCEGQQEVINSLLKRVEKLEGAATKQAESDNAAIEELNRYKEFYKKYTGDWGDQHL